MKRIWLVLNLLLLSLASAQNPKTLKLDYAYYNPVSLVLKQQGWLEQEFAKEGTKVEWVWSAGSNKANEYLASDSVHFASTAGSAALLARANGVPLKTVFIYSQPEWAALVVGKDSGIKSVADLKGKSLAVTRGTDPYFFLLQALKENGLSAKDLNVVYLQHPDGEQALLTERVQAWSGLDPYIADAQEKAGARIIFRQPLYNSYGFLNTTEQFAKENPEVVERVLRIYARGRAWAIAHPTETAEILAKASGLSVEVAKRVLGERTKFVSPVPGSVQRIVLERIAKLIKEENLAAPGADIKRALDTIFEPKFAEAALKPAQPAAQR